MEQNTTGTYKRKRIIRLIAVMLITAAVLLGNGICTFAEEELPNPPSEETENTQPAPVITVILKSASLPYTKTFGTGKAIKPEPKVKAVVDGVTATLKKGQDYTVSYKNNKNPGTASVIIKGKGNFKGTIKKTFQIIQMQISGSGVTRKITASPLGKNYNSLKAAVWTTRNGQNDLVWYPMKKTAKGNWTVKMKLANLKYDGKCNVQIYNGARLICGKTFTCSRKDWMESKSRQFRKWFLFGNDSGIDYVQTAINIAKNDYFGYGHSWFYDRHTISCAGLVGLSLTYCRYGDFIKNNPVQPDGTEWGYLDLGSYSGYNWPAIMINEVGAEWHAGTGGLRAGDILYYDYGYTSNHSAIYIGNGLIVEARGPGDGSPNDAYGTEITINADWAGLPWQGYFRIPSKKINSVTKWK